jgi:hypothetical protein
VFRGSNGAFSLTISLVEAEATSFQGLGDTGKSGGLDDAIEAAGLVAKTSVVESEVVMYLCSQPELQLRIVVVTVTDGWIVEARGDRVECDSFVHVSHYTLEVLEHVDVRAMHAYLFRSSVSE